jgi:hypothetical protein
MNSNHRYHPAWFAPGAHLQTLWARLFRRVALPPHRRLRWETADGDFVDVVRVDPPASAPADTPRLVLTHGLEGSSRSPYVRGILQQAAARGWGADLLLFRSCGDEINRTRRFYHSGETGDLALVVDRVLAEFPHAPLGLAGISLGGNVLLKYLGERGESVSPRVVGAVAVSVPFDLGRGARWIGRGFGRVYEGYFVRSLRRKALAKAKVFPDLADVARLTRVRTLVEFDELVTSRLHGFADADDYYVRSSALRFLHGVRRPTLLLSAVDDPFLPCEVLDEVRAAARTNPHLEPQFVAKGGHVGFVAGRLPWRPLYWAEWRVGDYLASRFGEAGVSRGARVVA